jgi:hypothetical protein
MKITKTLVKEIDEDIKKWKNLSCSWTELILSNCPYYSK